MKSGKQRRKEIKAARYKRAEKLAKEFDPFKSKLPGNYVLADHAELSHNLAPSLLPNFYMDMPYRCRDCDKDEIWTAKQQKWWYEIAKGRLEATAVRCSACRKIRRDEKSKQKLHMEEMAKKKPHPNEAFFKNT